MANNNLAYPYATAIFEIAKANNTMDAWLSDLNSLSSVAQNSDFNLLISNPLIGKQDVIDTILSLAKVSSKSVIELMSLLQENDRLQILPEIYILFEQKVEQDRNTAKAIIESAYPVTDQDKAKLEKWLSNKFNKTITATVKENKELIGGIKMLVNDIVIDKSVKGSIKNLATQLKR